jgi:hypothetical protein
LVLLLSALAAFEVQKDCLLVESAIDHLRKVNVAYLTG